MFAEVRAASEPGAGYPVHVEKEFSKYVGCGILGRGFLRVRCDACGEEELVAFSCHGKGFCPSCIGRRMNDVSTRLVDDILPHADYRQWVFTFPYRLRPLLAYDKKLWSKVISIAMSKVFSWQRKQARRLGYRKSEPLGLCASQRFGSLLQLNPHGHSAIPDGVLAFGDGAPIWVSLSAPTQSDVESIATSIVKAVLKELARRGESHGNDDEDSNAAYAEAACVERIERHLGDDESPTASPSDLSAVVTTALGRFSVHAGTTVSADDRPALERLIRYTLRPPLAQSRLSRTESGKVRYRLRKPYYDGRTEVVLSPVAFLKRLAAFVPPKGQHVIRYFGLLAPRAKHRKSIVGLGLAAKASASGDAAAAPIGNHDCEAEKPKRSSYRKSWAALLSRVFLHEALKCNRCGGTRKIIAGITDRDVVGRILDHLGLPSEVPIMARARPPPQRRFDFEPIAEEPQWADPSDFAFGHWDPADPA